MATATKALQDQLASKDLPFLKAQLAAHDGRDLNWAVLKGRSNYACLQRLAEIERRRRPAGARADVERRPRSRSSGWRPGPTRRSTGDVAELDWAPSDQAWRAVSVGSDECPGARRCPNGGAVLRRTGPQAGRRRPTSWSSTCTSTACTSAAAARCCPSTTSSCSTRPTCSRTSSATPSASRSGPARLTFLAAALRRVLDRLQGRRSALADGSLLLREALRPLVGKRLPPALDPAIADVLLHARRAVDTALSELASRQERGRRRQAARRCARRVSPPGSPSDIDCAITGSEERVPFVSGGPEHPRLEIAPLDVGPVLDAGVWTPHMAVLTSATIPASLPQRVGLVAADGKPTGPAGRGGRRRQPVRLRGQRAAVLRGPHARSTLAGLRGEDPRGADRPAHGRRRPHARPVHQLEGDGRRGRGGDGQRSTCRSSPSATCPSRRCCEDVRRRRGDVAVRDGRALPGRRHPRAFAVARRHRPDPVPPPGRPAAVGPPRAARAGGVPPDRPAPCLDAAGPGHGPPDPHRRPTAAWSPCSTHGSARPAYRWEIVNALPPMRRTRHRAEAEAFLREITG